MSAGSKRAGGLREVGADNAAAPPYVRTLRAKPRQKLASELFFDLADAVLSAHGRPPLGEPQRRIIEVREEDAVLQILAGPGAGKTEVLVWRVLYELFVNAAEPARIMVTTFTRKAAQELNVRMVERSDALLLAAREAGTEAPDPRVHDLRIGTIHSLCDELLNEFDDEHLAEGKEVIDEVETRLRLLQCRHWAFKKDGRNLLEEVLAMEPVRALFKPPWLDHLGTIDKIDATLALLNQHIETWIPRCEEQGLANGIEAVHGPAGLTETLATIQRRWADRLESNHTMDYPLLQKRFLEHQASVCAELDHVFVDEFQDTNPIQYAIHLGWVRGGDARLTVVGDDDQALYRWRGSDIGCFDNLGPDCEAEEIPYRREILEENNRSTATIIDFARALREGTALGQESLPKTVVAPPGTEPGEPVRLLEGSWSELCKHLAEEVDTLGAGRILPLGSDPPPSVAILMASTKEARTTKGTSPALELRDALEERGLRVYNPRNKAAARSGSPVHDLLGLLSYLIDPVSYAPAGKPKPDGSRREVQVWASNNDDLKSSLALTAKPPFRISEDHAKVQKRLIKESGGRPGAPGPELAPLFAFLDRVREDLVNAPEDKIRLTLGGLVARLLSKEPFRSSGYTLSLFRQALFTQLLDANVSVTRTSGKRSLERPMVPRRNDEGKIEWPRQYWTMLGAFGQLVEAGNVDDLEVEAFSEDAVALLTFHQAKGLEFDRVYVAMTGKEAEPSAVLATMLFSGETPAYEVIDGNPRSDDETVMRRAEADRDREVYVAVTRARAYLTILHDPKHDHPVMELDRGIASLFEGAGAAPLGELIQKEWSP